MRILATVHLILVQIVLTLSQQGGDGDLGPGTLNYLAQFGYMKKPDSKSGDLLSADYVKNAIKEFQRMAGIDMTGIVDKKTQEMMHMPRCGVPDNVGHGSTARRKRYALSGYKWSKTDLTYRVSRVSSKLTPSQVNDEIQRALDVWSKVTPLTFTRKDHDPVDIDIRFAYGNHGDNNPFDGSGSTLAHAFFPSTHGIAGDAHFDEAEQWTVNVQDGVNLFQVAAHEFGHSLGLGHSDTQAALMAPFYRGYRENFELDYDDVNAVQELYGAPRATNSPPRRTQPTTKSPQQPRPTSEPPVVDIPEVCRDPSIDAITRTGDGTTYIFKGIYYYRLNRHGVDAGYPRRISWDWRGVAGPIDAAITWSTGYTYLFKGSQYWKFRNLEYEYGPRDVSQGFRDIPVSVDSAFVWSGNGKTYFTKGEEYWRYVGTRADAGYPRPLSVWRGLPKSIDTAFKWENGRTYFFSGTNYYRYNDITFQVDEGYPRPIGVWWLGCPDQSQILQFDKDNADGTEDQDPPILSLQNEKDTGDQWVAVGGDQIVGDGASVPRGFGVSLICICLLLIRVSISTLS